MNILVTGASGFVGRALVRKLDADGHTITALLRETSGALPARVKQITFIDLSKLARLETTAALDDEQEYEVYERLKEALEQTDVLVHAAARVHVMNESADKPLTLYRETNTEPTLSLARLATLAGVKRFIFISTIKVNGELTNNRMPFSESDDCKPSDPYAISKYEAEIGLAQIAKTGMDVVIIRPSLIYGPGVRGNFATMMDWVNKGVPLPLGAVKNNRSLLALENLVDFIGLCLEHPKAANETFLLSDGKDVSTTELIQKIAAALGKRSRLFPVPMGIMHLVAGIIGKKEVASRVFGSLQVDSEKARRMLGWKPLLDMDEQLQKMNREFD
jgi:nucleoside-diphosphate-sugar epimerase